MASCVSRLRTPLSIFCNFRFENLRNYNFTAEKVQRVLSRSWQFNFTTVRCFFLESIEDQNTSNENVKKHHNLTRVLQNTPKFETMLNHHVQWTDVEWKSIRNTTLRSFTVSESNVDAIIMDACFTLHKPEASASYYKFLQDNNYQLNLAVIKNYLRTFTYKQLPLQEKDQEEIIKICEKIEEQYPVLDYITATAIAGSLCLTHKWKKAEKILKEYVDSSCYSVKTYSSLALAAFNAGDFETGWKYVECLFANQFYKTNVLLGFVDYLKKCKTDEKDILKEMEKMFYLWQRHMFYPSSEILKKYTNLSRELNWSVNSAYITTSGTCSHCQGLLEKLTLTNEEFNLLKDSLINKILNKSNLFKNTTPKEFIEFENFMRNSQNYNIVIDGLNLFYCNNPHFVKIIQHFLSRKMKVLVIIRKHVLKNKNIMRFLTKKTSYFTLHHLSNDDVYLLYATIKSGKNTYFLSNDLLRQHMFKLGDDNLKMIFRKWQFMRQYTFRASTNPQLKAVVNEPFTYLPQIQKNGSRWHIPSWDEGLRPTVDVFKNEIKWTCLDTKCVNTTGLK